MTTVTSENRMSTTSIEVDDDQRRILAFAVHFERTKGDVSPLERDPVRPRLPAG